MLSLCSRFLPSVFTVLVGVGFLWWSYHRNHTRLGDGNYEFDAGGKKEAFEPHAKRYQDLAKLVLTLAAASAAFLLSFLVSIDGKPSNSYGVTVRLKAAAPFAMVFLCLSAASCLTFMLLQNVYYEHYTHIVYSTKEGDTAKSSPYSGKKYAIVLMFAEASMFFFVLSYIVIGVWLIK
jgi:hypothetical protein